jgi:Flp pilus assembly protein TadG
MNDVRRRRPRGPVAGTRSDGCESGQAIVWVAVMLPLFLSVIGLAIDGGAAFNARLRLQQVAAGAARAAATQVDERAYRDSGGSAVVLDTARARRVAGDYLVQSGLELTGTVDAAPRRVTVEVSQDVPTSFLRIVGVHTVRIGAAAPAELRFGVERGNR